MRIDGGTKASGGQQAQSRFEQVMTRELSRAGSGKPPTESNVRVDLSASSKRKAPSSERVGVDFKAAEAGKILKGLQDATRQVLSKTLGQAGEAAKGAFTRLAAAAEGAMTKARDAATRTIGDGVAKEAFGKDGGAAGKSAPGAGKEGAAPGTGAPGGGSASAPPASAPKGDGASAQTPASATGTANGPASAAPGDGPRTDGPRTGGPAGSPTAPGTAPASPQQGTGAERAAPAAAPVPAEAPGAAPATTTGAEAAAGQEGRAVLLAAQNAPALHEAALLLHNPWLQSAAKKAAANGAELSMVFQLGPNLHGAEFVSVATDDTGFITGPEIEVALTGGAVDTEGNWVARRGEGMLKGMKIALEPDADGCAFVSDGEPDNPSTVGARIVGADPLRADVIAVRKLR